MVKLNEQIPKSIFYYIFFTPQIAKSVICSFGACELYKCKLLSLRYDFIISDKG